MTLEHSEGIILYQGDRRIPNTVDPFDQGVLSYFEFYTDTNIKAIYLGAIILPYWMLALLAH